MSASSDPFPPTRRTWLDRHLAAGDDERLEVVRHVMEVYAGPLEACLRHSRFRDIADPVEVVHGFFVDRLERSDYLIRWQASELPLRRWLANGVLLYARELLRRRRRDSRARDLPSDLSVDEAPELALDRAFARSVVRYAMERAAQACEAEGLVEHWRMFVGHRYQGLSYRQVGAPLGQTPERAAVMARTAERRFQDAVREVLELDGVPPERVRAAIAELLGLDG